MKRKATLVFFGLISFTYSIAQYRAQDDTSVGAGLGLDYGGMGVNVLYYTNQNLGFFGGIGYVITGSTYNLGLKYRFVPRNSHIPVAPYLAGMYGYHTYIKASNTNQYNKNFYGPTLGVGLDFLPAKRSKGYWTVGINLPLLNSDADNYSAYLKKTGFTVSKPSPVLVIATVGYRFIIN